MSTMTTAFVASAMRKRGYHVIEGDPVALSDGHADSRRVTKGSLWTAFRGETLNGNDYIDAALENGAAAVIAEREPAKEWPERTIVVAPDARRAVGELASAWLAHCGPRVVGITGTVGKTTAKEVTAELLGSRSSVHRSKENFNSLEGLPLALVSLPEDAEFAVLELAMDRPGEIVELCELVKPEIGVVLNIGLTHASRLGSIEAIAEEKLSLARWLPAAGTAVLNLDDERIAAAAGDLRCRVLTFGTSAGATLEAKRIEPGGLEGTSFTLIYEGREYPAHSPLPGAHTLPAALAALGVATAAGIEMEEAVGALAGVRYGGRMTRRAGHNGSTLLDDRYNSSPASLEGALRLLASMPGRRFALLGTMAELGEAEQSEHCRLGKVAAETCDVLAATGEPCRVLVEATRKAGLEGARWFATREDAAEWIRRQLEPGDAVLLKASRSQAFENIVPMLEAQP